ncbi:MAG: hypothetical protein VZR54_07105 [Ruminococcus sp.]|nr:hypothetical protein [Ruminococcus sp.]
MIKDIDPLLKECEETLTLLLGLEKTEIACYVKGFINSINKLPEYDLESVKKRLDLIEKKVRDAFNDEDIDKADGTFNRQRDAYRKAQVLADIFAIFEYDGATIGNE